MEDYGMFFMENYGMFFAGTALVTGLAIFLILIKLWITRRGRKNNREVMAENFRLQAAKIRVQTAEGDERAMRTAIHAEAARFRLIQAQLENDQAEIERRATLREADVDPDMPPPCKPKNWLEKISDHLHKHWFFAFVVLIVLIIILHKLNII